MLYAQCRWLPVLAYAGIAVSALINNFTQNPFLRIDAEAVDT
jgi:hypothetical protein